MYHQMMIIKILQVKTLVFFIAKDYKVRKNAFTYSAHTLLNSLAYQMVEPLCKWRINKALIILVIINFKLLFILIGKHYFYRHSVSLNANSIFSRSTKIKLRAICTS